MDNKSKKHAYTIIFALMLILGLFIAAISVSALIGKPLLGNSLYNGGTPMGNTNIGTIDNAMSANMKGGSYFDASVNGQVSDIFAYMCYQTTPGNAKAALYTDGGALIAVSNEVALPQNYQWVDFPIPSQPTVTASSAIGQGYMLVILRQTDAWIKADPSINNDAWNHNLYSSGFSDPFGTIEGYGTNGQTCVLSIYAVIQTGSPTPTPQPTATPVPGTATLAITNNNPSMGTVTLTPAPLMTPSQFNGEEIYTYPINQAVSVLSTPTSSSYVFASYTIASTGATQTTNPLPVIMTQNIIIDVNFLPLGATPTPTASPPPPIPPNTINIAGVIASITMVGASAVGLIKR